MDQNEVLFDRAQKSIPGGVNSPVRAFRSVGGAPRFIKKALGPHMYDVEGKQYIDYIGSWGPMILGHNNPHVIEAARRARSGRCRSDVRHRDGARDPDRGGNPPSRSVN